MDTHVEQSFRFLFTTIITLKNNFAVLLHFPDICFYLLLGIAFLDDLLTFADASEPLRLLDDGRDFPVFCLGVVLVCRRDDERLPIILLGLAALLCGLAV